jgi:hypothetical protein
VPSSLTLFESNKAKVSYCQRWAPALFSRFCAFALAIAKPKKERESAKKKEREKKREFALFPPPTVKIRFQSPKPLGRGKAMVLSKTIQ